MNWWLILLGLGLGVVAWFLPWVVGYRYTWGKLLAIDNYYRVTPRGQRKGDSDEGQR